MSDCSVTPDIEVPDLVDGALRVVVYCRVPADGATTNALVTLMEGFVRLADWGAYVPAHMSPRDARCRIRGWRHTAQSCTWDLDVAALDGRVARVLWNAVSAFSRLRHPVAKLTLRADVTKGRMPFPLSLDNAPVETLYPDRSKTVRVQVSQGAAGRPNAGRRIEIVFLQPLTGPVIEQVRGLLELWTEVSFAAYAGNDSDLSTGECAISDARCDIATADSIEMEVNFFGAPELAWHGLINLSERISTDIAEVLRLDIE